MKITFESATVTNCDYIGRTVHGVCAVVRDTTGAEVFRSKPSVKRICPRMDAEAFIAAAAAKDPAP